MAIYSMSHSAIGKTTHAAGTAGAHARYVTREGAARDILGEHMPTGRESSQAWLDAQEAADRKNARVIDKVLLALPIELDAAERAQVVRDFAHEVGRDRIPWMAGIHDKGEDAGNPHAHVIFRDRDIETGKRVAELSGKGSTERLRETWERMANAALERAGSAERIDRRSLEAQGIARQAGIHIGPNVLAMEERGVRPVSRVQLDGARIIDWPAIDQGRTRLDRQAEIEAANDNREKERGGKGKGRGDPMPATPANQNDRDVPAREPTPPADKAAEPRQAPTPEDERRAWAERLKGFGKDQAQEPQKDTQKKSQEPSGNAHGKKSPEAAQPASNEAQSGKPTSEQTSSPEPSRLRQAIDRARERLDALGNRLDQAFSRIRERFLEKDRQRQAKEAEQPRERAEAGRDRMRDLFRDRSRGRDRGPEMG